MSKIKVLHLFETFLPFTENWVNSLLSNTNNIEHHIGAHRILDNSLKSDNFKYAEKATDPQRIKYTSSNKKGIPRIIEKLSIEAYYLLFGNTPKKLVEYCQAEKIEILHAHFGNVAWDYLPLKKQTNLPFLISFYGWDYEKLPHTRPIFKKRFLQLFDIADAFICEGNHGAKILKNLGCPEHKIHVVRLGINVEDISSVKRNKKEAQLNLVQLASFTEKKGQVYVIQALQEIVKDCPNIHMTFIGDDRDGVTLEKMQKLVSRLGLHKFIGFLPAIDFSNLYSTLAPFDVFIHPSCYAADKDCEGGAPVVLLNAQALGIPIISTTHCDIPDEVIHKKTGLLSEEKNIKLLAENIKYFYHANNEIYQSFSENAKQHMRDNYDLSKNALDLSNIYTEILNQKVS